MQFNAIMWGASLAILGGCSPFLCRIGLGSGFAWFFRSKMACSWEGYCAECYEISSEGVGFLQAHTRHHLNVA